MAAFDKISQPENDLMGRAVSRTLLQFRNSAVFLDVLQGLIAECIALQTVILNVINLRGPADAAGENLNIIGRIVGQKRVIFDYTEIPWFTPDTEGLGADVAPAWVVGAPLYGEYQVNDAWYRELILARIGRNFAVYGSVPEIQDVIKQAIGYNISFRRVGMMEAQLMLPPIMPIWVINFLLRVESDMNIDAYTFAPYPATLNISSILYLPTGPFTPDIGDFGVDVGLAAVGQSISLGSVLYGG